MRRICLPILTVAFVALSLFVFAQKETSQYAGQETREIKSLSSKEIDELLNGQGMGLAKAAELNGYPGPRHVLDLQNELQLSAVQRAETQRIFELMRSDAVRLGRAIVEKEKALDALFARRELDANKLSAATREIALLQGDLRAVHLRAHLEMKRLLSPEQIKSYDTLRGYTSKDVPAKHQHQGHGKH